MIRRSTIRRSVAVPAPLLNDERLTWKAKGLAAYLLMKPDAWRIDARALARCGPDGRDSVLAGLRELRDAGYLHTRRGQDPATGRWWTESVLYEDPADAELDEPELEDLEEEPAELVAVPGPPPGTEVGFSGVGSPDPGKPGRNPHLERGKPPTPTGSADGDPPKMQPRPSPRELGTNPRARGTNPRGARPPDPLTGQAAAAERIAAINAARAAGELCDGGCDGGWIPRPDGALEQCPSCTGAGVRLTA
jgi:hypothetical protein